MKLVKIKYIPEVNKKYCKIEKLICDNCKQEIKEKEYYCGVNYRKGAYGEEDLKYKDFCKDCIKDGMYEMFMNNDYTNFDKFIWDSTSIDWEELSDYDMMRFGYKNIQEEINDE